MSDINRKPRYYYENDVELFVQLLLDKLDASEFFVNRMKKVEQDTSCDGRFDPFVYYFDAYVGAVMSVKNFYHRYSDENNEYVPYDRDLRTPDEWFDEDWKVELHEFLRSELRNPIHHPNEWIGEPSTGISRKMSKVNGRFCFDMQEVPDEAVEYWKQERNAVSYIPVVELSRTYLDILERYVLHMERIATDWFEVPQIGNGDMGNSYRPKYRDIQGIVGHAGNQMGDPDSEPSWVVKFTGTPEALDRIADKDDVRDLNEEEVVSLLNQCPHTGGERTFPEWDSSFGVSSRNYPP